MLYSRTTGVLAKCQWTEY